MSTWSEPRFGELASLITRRTGLVFAPNRCESLELSVRAFMRERSLTDLEDVQRGLLCGSLSWDGLIAHITVGETYFFRDKAHFEFLTERVLPELMAERGAAYGPRLWSAGCASGEEAYSLAMSLAESRRLERAFVLGTDLNRAALARARAARYTKWSVRGVEPHVLEKHFEWQGAEVVVPVPIRAHVKFGELNLAGFDYPSPLTSTFAMDLILCRNVLIYLSADTIRHVARRFFECLSAGGYLLTGPSDPLLSDAGFEIYTLPAGVVYRRPPAMFDAARLHRQPEPAAVATPRAARPALAPVPDESPMILGAPTETAQQAVVTLRARSDSAPLTVVEPECRAALLRHPLCAELYYLHALMLLDLGQKKPASAALRRAIYLDPSLAIAHFTLGSVLAGLRDANGAKRAYRNAEQCSRARPADEPVPCASEISARGLASAAARELSLLRAQGGSR